MLKNFDTLHDTAFTLPDPVIGPLRHEGIVCMDYLPADALQPLIDEWSDAAAHTRGSGTMELDAGSMPHTWELVPVLAGIVQQAGRQLMQHEIEAPVEYGPAPAKGHLHYMAHNSREAQPLAKLPHAAGLVAIIGCQPFGLDYRRSSFNIQPGSLTLIAAEAAQRVSVGPLPFRPPSQQLLPTTILQAS